MKKPKFRVCHDALPDSFANRVSVFSSGCWIWTGVLSERGYGRFWLEKKYVKAHKFAYEFFYGPVPKGLETDHICRNNCCVNPNHLEPVTHQVNVLRGNAPTAQNARKMECLNGHPLSGENLYTYKGGRQCKICRRARNRQWRKR